MRESLGRRTPWTVTDHGTADCTRSGATRLTTPSSSAAWSSTSMDPRLHALVQGAGPPVVLVHGGHGSSLDFSFRVAPLLARRYTTIAVDRPGAGRSGRPPDASSPRAQARMLRTAVAAMGFEGPILAGHSLGAAVALAWALEDEDVEALVTVAGYFLPGALPSAPGRVARHAAARPPAGGHGRPGGRPPRRPGRPAPRLPPGRARRPVRPARDAHRPAALASAHDAADRRALDAGLREILPSYAGLRCPLVAVAGLQDGVVSPWQSRRLVELVPEGELVLLPATGHLPHLTRPDAVVAAIDRAAALAARGPERRGAGQGETVRSGAPRRAPST